MKSSQQASADTEADSSMAADIMHHAEDIQQPPGAVLFDKVSGVVEAYDTAPPPPTVWKSLPDVCLQLRILTASKPMFQGFRLEFIFQVLYKPQILELHPFG